MFPNRKIPAVTDRKKPALLGYTKHFLFYSENKIPKVKIKHTRVDKKTSIIYYNILSGRIRKTST